jgi:hypothetical protein
MLRQSSKTHYAIRIGSCIYCSSSNGLSDEHVLAYSLGGSLILEDASCEECSDITKKFEQICARNMFGSFRAINRLPTRHKHERPKELDLLVEGPTGKQTIQVPVPDHPGVPARLPLLQPPGMRTGAGKQLPQTDTIPCLSITQIDRAKAEKIVNSTGADTLSSKNHKVDLPSFMRMHVAVPFTKFVDAPSVGCSRTGIRLEDVSHVFNVEPCGTPFLCILVVREAGRAISDA